MSQLTPGQRIHLIGIGGFGLSAIARVLVQQGYIVSGCDAGANAFTDALSTENITIMIGHDAAHIADVDAVLMSSAIQDGAGAAERDAALARGIPVYKRADMIAEVMRGYRGVTIAGTHGKTTTTSMMTHAFQQVGLSPSYIAGGVLGNTGTNAAVGQGRHFIIEADEYDNMFHGLQPYIAVLTNAEYDHPDFFTTPEMMFDSFRQFVRQISPDGVLVVCADDAGAMDVATAFHGKTITYGTVDHANWQARNIRFTPTATLFDVWHDGETIGTVELPVAGRHNVLNALAVLATAHHEGADLPSAISALASFKTTGRRFDVRAIIDDVMIIDDYAHHPTEIATNLDAARVRYPAHTLWAVWQPHTFQRSQALFDDFVRAFDRADHVIVTRVYRARKEAVPADFEGDTLANAMNHPDARFARTFDEAVEILAHEVQSPAVVLIMSAGDAPKIGIALQQKLEQAQ